MKCNTKYTTHIHWKGRQVHKWWKTTLTPGLRDASFTILSLQNAFVIQQRFSFGVDKRIVFRIWVLSIIWLLDCLFQNIISSKCIHDTANAAMFFWRWPFSRLWIFSTTLKKVSLIKRIVLHVCVIQHPMCETDKWQLLFQLLLRMWRWVSPITATPTPVLWRYVAPPLCNSPPCVARHKTTHNCHSCQNCPFNTVCSADKGHT